MLRPLIEYNDIPLLIRSDDAINGALDKVLLEAGVALWLDTLICDTVVEGQRVTGVEVENKSGRGLIIAKCVIDATGPAIC